MTSTRWLPRIVIVLTAVLVLLLALSAFGMNLAR